MCKMRSIEIGKEILEIIALNKEDYRRKYEINLK